MKTLLAHAAVAALILSVSANAAVQHYPAGTGTPGGASPPFSSAVMAGNTLYISGTTDGMDPATGKPPVDATAGAKVVLDNIKKTVEKAGLTMDDLVWVQIFTADLKYYADFNAVYRTYFKGDMPARAFIGAGSLLGGAHFEVMGIAVKPATAAKK
jgi:2-iminobutanoate/2-iminopropanoate deaminase